MSQNDLVVMKPQTETLENPLGIDVRQPLLGWGIGSIKNIKE